MPRALVIFAATLMLSSCVTPTTFGDYACMASSTPAGGELQVIRYLSARGAPIRTTLFRRTPLPAAAGLIMTVNREARAPTATTFDRGTVTVYQSFSSDIRNNSRSYRLEFMVQPTPPGSTAAHIGEQDVDAFSLRLTADWVQLRALARTDGHLFLVLQDRSARTIYRQPLDDALFDAFEPEATQLLAETGRMATDYRNRCMDNNAAVIA